MEPLYGSDDEPEEEDDATSWCAHSTCMTAIYGASDGAGKKLLTAPAFARHRKKRLLPKDWYMPLEPGMMVSESGDFFIESKGMRITHTSIRTNVSPRHNDVEKRQALATKTLLHLGCLLQKEQGYRVRRYDEEHRERRAAKRRDRPLPSDFTMLVSLPGG